MESISHREMRNNSSEVLRRVAAGESFVITNNGEPAALLSPPRPPLSRFDEMVATGEIIPAAHELDVAALPEPMDLEGPSTAELIAELRGRR
ncbi:type II toxin-antitoxin system prevent-host-death family antitoxin [Modestobacter sp. I12A-02628]|uniref:Antitoxin n=1 Tax=Goekera deserti TaxID=2497753 RepID=A0A7K3WCX7_9ACTN|nr:type II toxin-antitoxin system prevent-host-death family antitoxin [Goekera deserti]MPQ98607.1 type II toxin-antitoxin system prevent-host-death family antitoxin [Goekera deserti]NDI49023.1 type II toxin-antitoxin system prevent-host-death family antitoxin [Goekera deserti]NEL54186.1 type II toxin-antitoxin system prevent-host-death family antitoxin [Goekera deserti]